MKARALSAFLAVLAVLAVLPTAAFAGEVYGIVTDGPKAVGDAATVEAKCGEKTFAPVATDKSGSYHLMLDKTGKCSLTVKYKQQSAAVDIASYDEPVQVDIALEVKDGHLTARRK